MFRLAVQQKIRSDIYGTLPVEQWPQFQRQLFRSTRGNALVRSEQVITTWSVSVFDRLIFLGAEMCTDDWCAPVLRRVCR